MDQKLQAGDSTAARQEIRDLSGQLEELQKAYGKKRSTFRSDLTQLMNRKQNLGERVEGSIRHQDELDHTVAMLYLMRIGDVVKASGAADGSKLSPNEREMIKAYLDKAISLAPEVKMNIEQMFPKLIQALYPDPSASTNTASGTEGQKHPDK